MPAIGQRSLVSAVRLVRAIHLNLSGNFRRSPNHRRGRVIWSGLSLAFRLCQVLAVGSSWDGVVTPEDASSLQLGDEEFDDVGESAGHEGIGLW